MASGCNRDLLYSKEIAFGYDRDLLEKEKQFSNMLKTILKWSFHYKTNPKATRLKHQDLLQYLRIHSFLKKR